MNTLDKFEATMLSNFRQLDEENQCYVYGLISGLLAGSSKKVPAPSQHEATRKAAPRGKVVSLFPTAQTGKAVVQS